MKILDAKKSIALALAALTLAACSQQNFSVPDQNVVLGQRATYSKEVDILWVMDTSGSMSSLQAKLAQQAPAFIQALETTGLDYQMAVTTMDMSSSGAKGRFLAQTGTPAILTKNTANMLGLLSGRLQAGDGGSPQERALDAVKSALSGSPSTTTNAGFLRANSLLVLIFLTNEDDKSEAFNPVTYLDSIRPKTPFGDRSWITHFMGVLPDDPTCMTSGSFGGAGFKYMDMAAASGGISVAVCDADMARAVTGIRARLLEVLTEWRLDRKPIISTIQVIVDGKVLPQSTTNGWAYFEEKNTVRFYGNAIPRIDSVIQVNFSPSGLK